MPKTATKKTIKRKIQRKKAAAKEPVKQMDLHQAFDLTDVSDETLESYAFYLKEMVHSAGWKLMVQVLQGNLAILEKQIVSKKEVMTNRLLSDEEVDSLRDQHEILSELMNKPHELIKQYSKDEGEVTEYSYDPYGGNNKTLNAATMSDTT